MRTSKTEEKSGTTTPPINMAFTSLHERITYLARFLAISLGLCTISVYVTLAYYLLRGSAATSRRIINALQQYAFDLIFYVLPPCTMQLTGDVQALFAVNTRTKILIANHSTDVDWLYLWMLAQSQQRSGNVKILLKRAIRNLPIFGAMMDKLSFIWLKRNWEEDREFIRAKLTALQNESTPETRPWVFLFPEGMTMNTRSMLKSRAYARECGRMENLELTLLPRNKGLECVIHACGGADAVELYDVTMAFSGYTGEVPTWEMGYERKVDVSVPNVHKLLAGAPETAQECHMHIRRVELEKEAQSHQDLAPLLDSLWRDKDLMLQRFAREQNMCGKGKATAVQVRGSATGVAMLTLVEVSVLLLAARRMWKWTSI